jgi:hypothetical protein
MITFDQSNFNHENFESSHTGHVHIGNHSTYDFEVYSIDGQLWFMCHDDPEFVQSYDEVKRDMFTDNNGGDLINYDGKTLDQQLQDQGLVV